MDGDVEDEIRLTNLKSILAGICGFEEGCYHVVVVVAGDSFVVFVVVWCKVHV